MNLTDNCLTEVTTLHYTEQQWEEDSYRLFVERVDPLPCPKCNKTGFFGPRAADPGVKFRCCRFCGFHQVVGAEPAQMVPVVHSCDDWPECARAPYVWWVQVGESRFTCPFCEVESDVRARNVFTPGVSVNSPFEVQEHPWSKVPQNRPYDYYQRFWENWEFTKGRIVL